MHRRFLIGQCPERFSTRRRRDSDSKSGAAKFLNPKAAEKALDDNLKNNIPTGLQVGVYGLTYFPDEYRFHFNAHNCVVYGKTETHYLVSDPVMETVTTLTHQIWPKCVLPKEHSHPEDRCITPFQSRNKQRCHKPLLKGLRKPAATCWRRFRTLNGHPYRCQENSAMGGQTRHQENQSLFGTNRQDAGRNRYRGGGFRFPYAYLTGSFWLSWEMTNCANCHLR